MDQPDKQQGSGSKEGDARDVVALVQSIARLAHDLRNSTTILFGVMDELEELKHGDQRAAIMLGDLERATDNIQRVTNELASLGG